MREIAFVNDDPARRNTNHGVIASECHTKRRAPEECGGFKVLAEERTEPDADELFTAAELRTTVTDVLAGCPAVRIEIVSAVPEWVELRVPCDLRAIPPLQKLLAKLDADLPQETGEAISYAFREMLSNAPRVRRPTRPDEARRDQIHAPQARGHLPDQRSRRRLRPRAAAARRD